MTAATPDELRALREETKERLDDAIHDQRSMAAILRLRKTVAALDQAASDRAALDRVRALRDGYRRAGNPFTQGVIEDLDAALCDEQEGKPNE